MQANVLRFLIYSDGASANVSLGKKWHATSFKFLSFYAHLVVKGIDLNQLTDRIDFGC